MGAQTAVENSGMWPVLGASLKSMVVMPPNMLPAEQGMSDASKPRTVPSYGDHGTLLVRKPGAARCMAVPDSKQRDFTYERLRPQPSHLSSASQGATLAVPDGESKGISSSPRAKHFVRVQEMQ